MRDAEAHAARTIAGPMKNIPCPCCSETLYELRNISGSHAGWALSKNSTRLRSDQQGYYMKCPHCAKRVVFATVSSVVGLGFGLAPTQVCADCKDKD